MATAKKTTSARTSKKQSKNTAMFAKIGSAAFEAYKRNRVRHPFLRDRDAGGMWLVLRLDRYRTQPANRGQFYPTEVDEADLPSSKALWPSPELALHAAEWAAREFGHQYGVFRLTRVVERQEAPLRVSVLV